MDQSHHSIVLPRLVIDTVIPREASTLALQDCSEEGDETQGEVHLALGARPEDIVVTRIRVKAATALHGKDRFAQFAVIFPRPKRMKLHVVDIPFNFPVEQVPSRST